MIESGQELTENSVHGSNKVGQARDRGGQQGLTLQQLALHLSHPFSKLRTSYMRARRTISGKIKLASGFSAGLLLALGAIVTVVFWQVGERSEANNILAMGARASADLNASIAETRYHTARYADNLEEAQIVEALRRLEEAKARLDETILTSRQSNMGELEDVAWLRAQVEGYELEIDALKRAVASGHAISIESLSNAVDLSGQLLAESAQTYEDQFIAEAETSNAQFESFQKIVAILFFFVVVVGAVTSIIIARVFVTHFADAIREMTRSMVSIAAGREDVDIPGAARRDEIGAMARALTVFREKANEVVRLEKDVAEASKRELEQREEAERQKRQALSSFADQFETDMSGVVGHVASASEQLHSTASAMATSANSASDLSRQVALSVNETTNGVTFAATATEQFANSIEEVGRQAARSALVAQDASVNARSADTEIEQLHNTSHEASKLIELISSIAQRTNLLALNASIEAARGGEAGRGFAVVASEVKELAQQTQTATDAVARQINAIQNSTALSVSALKEIAKQIHEMEFNATAIAQSVEEQTAASRELASNIERAAKGSSALSAQFQRVNEMAQANGETAQHLVSAAGGLQTQAHALDSQTRQFATKVRAS